MNVIETPFEGLYVIEPDVFDDNRGYFFEAYSRRRYDFLPGDCDFVQDNESLSRFGVLRGLHYQKNEYAQAKLVRVASGVVRDVVLDLRPQSSTFGRHFSLELSGENKRQLFIPKGFAHGFLTLSAQALFIYKCAGYYVPGSEGSVNALDPALGIDWGLEEERIIRSEKDILAPMFNEIKL